MFTPAGIDRHRVIVIAVRCGGHAHGTQFGKGLPVVDPRWKDKTTFLAPQARQFTFLGNLEAFLAQRGTLCVVQIQRQDFITRKIAACPEVAVDFSPVIPAATINVVIVPAVVPVIIAVIAPIGVWGIARISITGA
ncbi:MAG: hypothetical protein ACKVP2_05935 [Burkholderiales bacterium]